MELVREIALCDVLERGLLPPVRWLFEGRLESSVGALLLGAVLDDALATLARNCCLTEATAECCLFCAEVFDSCAEAAVACRLMGDPSCGLPVCSADLVLSPAGGFSALAVVERGGEEELCGASSCTLRRGEE